MRRLSALPVLAAVLAVYLVAPFLAGIGQIGLADWAGVDGAGLANASLVSFASSTLATMLVAIGGIPLGYLLARKQGRAMALLGFVVQLPLALPPLASGILLLFLLGYASPLGELTGGRLTDSFLGIVLAEAFVAAPFLIIAARSAFAGVDPVLEDVVATLGHRPRAVFWRVSLALSWRGIWAGLLLTWLRAFGEFGATVMVAYHPYSLPVFTYVAFGSEGLPAMLPVLLPTLLVAVVVMALSQLAFTQRKVRPQANETLLAPLVVATRESPAGQTLSLAFRREREGFTLNVAWQTQARRLAILGASGSGKSATLRLIAGLDPAEAKSLTLGDFEMTSLPPELRQIAYVPQNYGLLPNLAVAPQIRIGVDCDLTQARHWTQRLGLGGLEHRLPAELSLGQQQRVALARALSRKSRLLLLDEPFSALDAALRARLRRDLLALQNEIDITSILVTHDPAEAMMLADELLLLENGHVLQSGKAADLYARPANEVAARLLGADNVCSAVVTASDCIDLGGGIDIPVAGPPLSPGPVGWSVLPESVRLSGDNGVPGEVLDVSGQHFGRRLLVVRIGHCTLQATCDPSQDVKPGPVRVTIDPAALQVWPSLV